MPLKLKQSKKLVSLDHQNSLSKLRQIFDLIDVFVVYVKTNLGLNIIEVMTSYFSLFKLDIEIVIKFTDQ